MWSCVCAYSDNSWCWILVRFDHRHALCSSTRFLSKKHLLSFPIFLSDYQSYFPQATKALIQLQSLVIHISSLARIVNQRWRLNNQSHCGSINTDDFIIKKKDPSSNALALIPTTCKSKVKEINKLVSQPMKFTFEAFNMDTFLYYITSLVKSVNSYFS